MTLDEFIDKVELRKAENIPGNVWCVEFYEGGELSIFIRNPSSELEVYKRAYALYLRMKGDK